jgi:hypothetical protein
MGGQLRCYGRGKLRRRANEQGYVFLVTCEAELYRQPPGIGLVDGG